MANPRTRARRRRWIEANKASEAEKKQREAENRKREIGEACKALEDALRADAKAARKRYGIAPMEKPDNGETGRVLRKIAGSHLPLWTIARVINLTEEERAMITTTVAPELAWKPPETVRRQTRELDRGPAAMR